MKNTRRVVAANASAMAAKQPGDKLTLRIRREAVEQAVELTL